MVLEQNAISAEELFGVASQLVTQSDGAALSGILSLGMGYQIATGVVALLFVFIMVSYYEPMLYLLFASLGNKGSGSNARVFSSEVKNVEIFLGIIGVIVLALLTLRLSIMSGLRPLFLPLSMVSTWEMVLVVSGALVALILGERVALHIVGAVCDCDKFCMEIWESKVQHFCATMVLVAPMSILSLLAEGGLARISLYISIAVGLISAILFIKDSFLLFRTQRFSIFHWILYLCTLEIFPLSLLLAPIARG